MAKETKDLVVALDIGTSKVAALVAELRADGSIEILGMGGHESKGLKKGVVVNIESTVNAVQRASTRPAWWRSRTARWARSTWSAPSRRRRR
jgi:cell division ATPase FtsA